MDRLSDDELHVLSGPQLLDRTKLLVESMNALAAELSRTVRVADNKQAFERDGMKSAQSWLRGHCRLSRVAASQVVRNGRALEQLPTVAVTHAAGNVTADQVTLIGLLTAPRYAALLAEQNGDLAGIAEVLARYATTRRHDELARLVHEVLARIDHDGREPDPTEERFLSFAKHTDGSITGRFHLDAVGGEKLQAAIESIRQANRPAGDTRSLSQQQADALVQLCDIHLGCGTLPLLRQVRPAGQTARGREHRRRGPRRPVDRSGGGPGRVRRHPLRRPRPLGRLRRGHHAHRPRPQGQPLDVGRTYRLVTRRLARPSRPATGPACSPAVCPDLVVRGSSCPGVDPRRRDVAGELRLLCERHHTQVHHGFRIDRDTGGRWRTYRPDGTEIHVLRPASAGVGELAHGG